MVHLNPLDAIILVSACSPVTNGDCDPSTAASSTAVGTTLDECIIACGTSGIVAVHLIDSANCLCFTTCSQIITQRVDLTTSCTPPGCTESADTTCSGTADAINAAAVTSADDCVTYCNGLSAHPPYMAAVLVGTSCRCYTTCTVVNRSFCAY